MSIFTIAIVGKTNVGKSTLFNLLSKKNLAIVKNIRGTTVDYKENNINFFGLELKIIDTGGITHTQFLLKDHSQDIIAKAINQKAMAVIQRANLVFLVVDGKAGLSYEDIEVATLLRKNNCNVILVVNKVDNNKISATHFADTQALGFTHVVEISAIHKTGLHDLYKVVEPFYNDYLATQSSKIDDEPPFLSIAIVGKPNTGKSTLINSLIKDDRLVISKVPGTTRDAIPVYLNYKNKLIRIIDTAGLVRKARLQEGLDTLAQHETIRSIIFAQVVILVIDATEGITKPDLNLANYILKEGRALIIVLNKIDLIDNPTQLKQEISTTLNQNFSNAKGISIITTSGLKSINLNVLLNETFIIYNRWSTTIKTSLLNRWLRTILEYNPPPLNRGRLLKIKFISQDRTRPPTFNLWVNLKDGVPSSYLMFLKNQIYKSFNLWGVPIRLNVKVNKNPYIRE